MHLKLKHNYLSLNALDSISIELEKILNDEIRGSNDWINERHRITSILPDKLLTNYISANNNINNFNYDFNNEFVSSLIEDKITIGITTCKRLDLYIKTINSLMKNIGKIPNDLIYEVILFNNIILLI